MALESESVIVSSKKQGAIAANVPCSERSVRSGTNRRSYQKSEVVRKPTGEPTVNLPQVLSRPTEEPKVYLAQLLSGQTAKPNIHLATSLHTGLVQYRLSRHRLRRIWGTRCIMPKNPSRRAVDDVPIQSPKNNDDNQHKDNKDARVVIRHRTLHSHHRQTSR